MDERGRVVQKVTYSESSDSDRAGKLEKLRFDLLKLAVYFVEKEDLNVTKLLYRIVVLLCNEEIPLDITTPSTAIKQAMKQKGTALVAIDKYAHCMTESISLLQDAALMLDEELKPIRSELIRILRAFTSDLREVRRLVAALVARKNVTSVAMWVYLDMTARQAVGEGVKWSCTFNDQAALFQLTKKQLQLDSYLKCKVPGYVKSLESDHSSNFNNSNGKGRRKKKGQKESKKKAVNKNSKRGAAQKEIKKVMANFDDFDMTQCIYYNGKGGDGGCNFEEAKCHYSHKCGRCKGSHSLMDCPGNS